MSKHKGKNKRPGSHQPRMKRTAKSKKKFETATGYASRMLFRAFYFKGGRS